MSKLDYMDALSRLAAPADESGLECLEITHSVLVGAAAEINPQVRAAGISVQLLGKTACGAILEKPAPVDQAGIGNQEITLVADNNGKGVVLKRPPGPEVIVPIDIFNPFTLGFNPVTEPGKMLQCGIS